MISTAKGVELMPSSPSIPQSVAVAEPPGWGWPATRRWMLGAGGIAGGTSGVAGGVLGVVAALAAGCGEPAAAPPATEQRVHVDWWAPSSGANGPTVDKLVAAAGAARNVDVTVTPQAIG